MMSCDNNSMRMEPGCNHDSYMPHMCVGYAYVMPQRFTETYDPCKALFCGTLFPQLDMPLGVYEKMEKCCHE